LFSPALGKITEASLDQWLFGLWVISDPFAREARSVGFNLLGRLDP